MASRRLPAILGALAFLGAAAQPAASGTFVARGHVDIVVNVPRTLVLRLVDHPAALTVTLEDIARGSMTVDGMRLDIVANNRHGYLMRAEIAGATVAQVEIEGLEAPVRISDGATSVAMPSMVGRAGPGSYAVRYHMQLAPGALPGRYPWPVALTLQEP